MDDVLEMFNPQRVIAGFLQILPDLLAAVFVIVMFYAAFRATYVPFRGALRRIGVHETIVTLLVNKIWRAVLLVFGLVMAAEQVGINVGAALAGIGVAGLAVGFAAQDSISNFIAGFVIFIDKPFHVDHWVTVAGHYGRVDTITMRSTRIRTNRNTFVVIPNKTIIDSVIMNHTQNGSTRVEVPVGIAYKEDVAKARAVILQAVSGLDGVAATPAPDVVMTELAASGVNLLVRVWIDQVSREQPIGYQVLEASKLALDQAGIEIPYPHLQLFIEKVEDRVWQSALGFVAAQGSDGGAGRPGAN